MTDLWENPKAYTPCFTDSARLGREPVKACAFPLGFDAPESDYADRAKRQAYSLCLPRLGPGAPTKSPEIGDLVELVRPGARALKLKIYRINFAVGDYWDCEAREC